MSETALQGRLEELTRFQREAVEWDGAGVLVLAGPGSGKTQTLTCRIARLLQAASGDHRRVLALTFTNKAAHEMKRRVAALVPGEEDRAFIGTFHGFCAHVLRQHGVHVGIKPDFGIYARPADRRAVLTDALERETGDARQEDVRLLPMIDHLQRQLTPIDHADETIAALRGIEADPSRVAEVYRLYRDALRRANALDFNSLIHEAYTLFKYPAITRHYQESYPHWLVDEFQDTNRAQYSLLRRLAGDAFRQIFAVADDDQIIFEWNGASVRRIRELVTDFNCDVIQLSTNFRCPPEIVEAGNRLVVYNSRRVTSKRRTTPLPEANHSDEAAIECRVFETDLEEAAGVARELVTFDVESRTRTAVVARTRALLENVKRALDKEEVPAVMSLRRDDFVSPEMRWFAACLKQVSRPLDKRNMARLVEAFDAFCRSRTELDRLESQSESEGRPVLMLWTETVKRLDLGDDVTKLVDVISQVASSDLTLARATQEILGGFESNEPSDDLKDDINAWRKIEREIGKPEARSLDRFLQELDLRSKEPVPETGAVNLTTIHAAKGREFDTVYLVGLAEEVLPSWQSIQKGPTSSAIEEERRGCFVAITRARKRLVLSRARQYRGWRKEPSRFLREMDYCSGDMAGG